MKPKDKIPPEDQEPPQGRVVHIVHSDKPHYCLFELIKKLGWDKKK